MTPYGVISTIRLLLDDIIDYQLLRSKGLTLDGIINEAQLAVISKAYSVQDERCLRPLYQMALQITDGTQIINMLYPRGCTIYTIPPINQPPFTGNYAKYVEYDEYINSNTPVIGPGILTPTTSQWTLIESDKILFTNNTGLETADVLFIQRPVPFNFVPNNIPTSTGLSLPPEYHYSVCAMVAHILSVQNVNEYQQESDEYHGAKINYSNINLGQE